MDSVHLIAGTLAGASATAIMYPIELIKTRMQVTDRLASNPYKSFTGGFRWTLGRDGISGLYRGMSPALIAASGSWGGYFYVYELAKKRRLQDSINLVNGKLGVKDHVRRVLRL